MSVSASRTCDGSSYRPTICNINSFGWDVMDTALDAICVKALRHWNHVDWVITAPRASSWQAGGASQQSLSKRSFKSE
jgi:hypothetical protein